MKNLYGQYPDIYSTDDTHYTYYFDNGTRVTLIAGENGITEEWIRTLKLEHRKEYNMLRQGQKRKTTDDDDDSTRIVSLDRYMEEVGDAGQALEDHASDVEGNYIAGVERSERREAIKRIMDILTPEQRKLLIRVRVQKVTIAAIAQEENVTEGAIRDRLRKVDRKISKNLQKGATD